MCLTFSVPNVLAVQVLFDTVGCLQVKIEMSCDVREKLSRIICSLKPKWCIKLNGAGGWLRAWAVCLGAAFLTFPPCFSSAGCHTERAQWFQEQRNGSARVESPFNQVMVLELDWCRFLCSWTLWNAGGDWKSLTTLVFFSSNLLGSTDHRDHHSLSRAVPLWHSLPLRALSAGQ